MHPMFNESQISIWTEADYFRLLAEVETKFLAQPNDPEFDRVCALSDLIYRYEAIHHPVPARALEAVKEPKTADNKSLQTIR